MQIKVRRKGGLAGIDESAEADTGKLPAAVARQLETLVRDAHILDPPAKTAATQVGSDFVQATIEVTEAGRQHTLTFIDQGGAETAPLNQIIDLVLQAARN